MNLRPAFREFKENKTKYILTYLGLIMPASVFFPGKEVVYLAAFGIAVVLFHTRRLKYDYQFILFISFLTILFFIQGFIFGTLSQRGTFGFFLLFLFPYYYVKIIGSNIFKYYVNIILVIALISFVFYVPSVLFPSVYSFIETIAPALGTDYLLKDQNFIIYTWEPWSQYGLLRNSGNFTEPGAFGAYLIIALLFNIIQEKKLMEKKNIIFMIALITTYSTGGYVAFFLLLSFYFLLKRRISVIVLTLPLLVIMSWQAYKQLEFLDKKVSSQIEYQLIKGDPFNRKGRFAAAYRDLIYLSEYWATGRGLDKRTRLDESHSEVILRYGLTNGLTDPLVRLGVFGFLVYMFLVHRSLRNYCGIHNFKKNFAVFGVIVICAVAFGQSILLGQVMISIAFLGFILSNKKLVINKGNLVFENSGRNKYSFSL